MNLDQLNLNELVKFAIRIANKGVSSSNLEQRIEELSAIEQRILERQIELEVEGSIAWREATCNGKSRMGAILAKKLLNNCLSKIKVTFQKIEAAKVKRKEYAAKVRRMADKIDSANRAALIDQGIQLAKISRAKHSSALSSIQSPASAIKETAKELQTQLQDESKLSPEMKIILEATKRRESIKAGYNDSGAAELMAQKIQPELEPEPESEKLTAEKAMASRPNIEDLFG